MTESWLYAFYKEGKNSSIQMLLFYCELSQKFNNAHISKWKTAMTLDTTVLLNKVYNLAKLMTLKKTLGVAETLLIGAVTCLFIFEKMSSTYPSLNTLLCLFIFFSCNTLFLPMLFRRDVMLFYCVLKLERQQCVSCIFKVFYSRLKVRELWFRAWNFANTWQFVLK